MGQRNSGGYKEIKLVRMPVAGIRPVGMSVYYFYVSMFVNVGAFDRRSMFMCMMKVVCLWGWVWVVAGCNGHGCALVKNKPDAAPSVTKQ